MKAAMQQQSEPTRDQNPLVRFLPRAWIERPSKMAGALIALIVLVLIFTLPVPAGISREAFRALLMLVVGMALWLPEVFHPSVSSLLLVGILPLTGVADLDQAASGLGDKIIWLLLGVSLLTAALQTSGLDRRLAYQVIRRSGGTAAGMLLAVILTGLLFAFIIPNSLARTALIVPLCSGILSTMNIKPLESNLGRSLMIAASMTSLLTSAAVITGASATIYSAGFFESVLGFHWTYLDWLITMFPGVLIDCLLLWLILLRLFPPEVENIKGGLQFIDEELRKLGRMNAQENKLVWIIGALFILLLFGDRLGIPRETAFLLIGLCLFLPGIELLEWSKASSKVNWGTLIFFAASLTLSKTIVDTGAADWLAAQLVRIVAGFPVWLVTVSVIVMFMILRFAFTNMTSVLITLLPVIVSLANSMGLNPVWLGMVAVVASALCLFTPMQSASNFTSYTTGYYEIADFGKAGLLVALAVTVVTLVVAMTYWPLVGLHP